MATQNDLILDLTTSKTSVLKPLQTSEKIVEDEMIFETNQVPQHSYVGNVFEVVDDDLRYVDLLVNTYCLELISQNSDSKIAKADYGNLAIEDLMSFTYNFLRRFSGPHDDFAYATGTKKTTLRDILKQTPSSDNPTACRIFNPLFIELFRHFCVLFKREDLLRSYAITTSEVKLSYDLPRQVTKSDSELIYFVPHVLLSVFRKSDDGNILVTPIDPYHVHQDSIKPQDVFLMDFSKYRKFTAIAEAISFNNKNLNLLEFLTKCETLLLKILEDLPRQEITLLPQIIALIGVIQSNLRTKFQLHNKELEYIKEDIPKLEKRISDYRHTLEQTNAIISLSDKEITEKYIEYKVEAKRFDLFMEQYEDYMKGEDPKEQKINKLKAKVDSDIISYKESLQKRMKESNPEFVNESKEYFKNEQQKYTKVIDETENELSLKRTKKEEGVLTQEKKVRIDQLSEFGILQGLDLITSKLKNIVDEEDVNKKLDIVVAFFSIIDEMIIMDIPVNSPEIYQALEAAEDLLKLDISPFIDGGMDSINVSKPFKVIRSRLNRENFFLPVSDTQENEHFTRFKAIQFCFLLRTFATEAIVIDYNNKPEFSSKMVNMLKNNPKVAINFLEVLSGYLSDDPSLREYLPMVREMHTEIKEQK